MPDFWFSPLRELATMCGAYVLLRDEEIQPEKNVTLRKEAGKKEKSQLYGRKSKRRRKKKKHTHI